MVLNESVVIGVIIITVLWLLGLTVALFRFIDHYNRLTNGISKTGLRDILDVHLKGLEDSKRRIGNIEKEIDSIRSSDMFHIQRIGIVRFNPFSDTGGAQSFTMALLDGTNNGVVMTSLYGRNGNRWYIKEIVKGSGKNLELSKEEQTAIKQAGKVDA